MLGSLEAYLGEVRIMAKIKEGTILHNSTLLSVHWLLYVKYELAHNFFAWGSFEL